MDLRHLSYLIQIVDSGTFSKAAVALRLAQPSLSQRIKHLEGELGVELLHRSPAGVRPTEIGAVVVEHARAILKQVDHLRLEVRGAAREPRGDVAVGLPQTMSLHLTVPLVQQVRARYPGINLRVTEGMSGHVQEWLQTGRVDIALLYHLDGAPGLELEKLLTEDLYLIVPRGHPQDSAASIRLTDIAALPLALPARDHGLRRTIERIASGAGITLSVPVEVDSLPHMKRLVAEGRLFTILPWAACREEIRAELLAARRIVAPVLRRPVVLAVARDRPLTLAARRVRELTASLVLDALGPKRARG